MQKNNFHYLKQVLNVLIFTICVSAIAQNNYVALHVLTSDSLPIRLNQNWRFSANDDSAYANPRFNDSEWKMVNPAMRQDKDTVSLFNGIGWFRYAFSVDSSLQKKPLSLSLNHLGASKIYLDGKLLKSYGVIADSAHCIYYNPNEKPFIFNVFDSGTHVLAIRYANYNTNLNFTRYSMELGGFEILLDNASHAINFTLFKSIIVTIICFSLSGIFFVLFAIHLLLFLFYPTKKSNLYFSIFMVCLASLFVIGFIVFFSNKPYVKINFAYYTSFFFALMFMSLSAFLNEHFTEKKGIRFRTIIGIGIVTIISRFIGYEISTIIKFTLLLVFLVSLEALILIVRAIYLKIKGAKIIGIGIFCFCLLILANFSMEIISGGNFEFNDNTSTGQMIVALTVLAFLSIPGSMSVYLAWDFAGTNKALLSQLNQVKELSEKNVEHEKEKVRLVTSQNEMLEEKVLERTQQLTLEKKKSDDLLLNILPEEVAEELKLKGYADARSYEEVTVLFTDFVNFTGISAGLSPSDLLQELNICFKAFDEITARHGMEKIKTIGDAYLAVCGLPMESKAHAYNTILAAKEIIEFVNNRKNNGGLFEIRIGVHSGPVVAGIVGIKKFAYDIWGDTVNMANRMESSGEKGKINISRYTYELVKNNFQCTYRGKIDAKGKGLLDMYFIETAS